MPEWDKEVDLLVAGSGAAALAAAVTGSHEGLKVLVVESTDMWGGTTAISGGGLWMPGHPGMEALGKQDSEEAVLRYMEETIGDVGPASSLERRKAFIRGVPRVYRLLESLGLEWAPSKDYPDYYPDKPGGMAGGRSIEAQPFDAKRLGDDAATWRTADMLPPIPIKTDDVWLISRAWSTSDGFIRGAKFFFRTMGGLVTGKKLYGLGGGYTGALMRIVKDQGTEVMLSSPVTALIKERDAVVGAEVTTPSGMLRVKASKGVVLGTGGFARNKEWRLENHGIEGYTSAPEGDVGSGIQVGIDAGGDVALMDDAWWGASVPDPEGKDAQFLVAERSMPFTIFVDQEGRRFTNESASYIDVGHDILEHHRTVPTIPCWMIIDRRHRHRYLFNAFLTGTKKYKEAGILVEADTLEELASELGMDPKVLTSTVERFNGFARAGVDEDFERGRTAYDNYYGDPTVHPNPNLGTLEKGPFQAVQVVPGDLGTKGGLLTDEHARVISTKGAPIPGLYASGNATASVMGRTYPGAGSTIGPATVFGYLAAMHAASRP
ncbi:FAD-binding protein [Demequina sp. NBRC 110054]|uniref:FAD-binding protein n=1 Tax=Demequina sp. NBRC 110054 TaxID=1570343 RepID=UPI000A034A41|nr:FAD-binding protein [Demequina sp. NBRC 110054]